MNLQVTVVSYYVDIITNKTFEEEENVFMCFTKFWSLIQSFMNINESH